MWFAVCYFPGAPLVPGCLGLDAMWQLVGFYLGWRGNPGRGRALGCGEVKFTGQILPTAKKISYHISLKRVIERKLIMGIADGRVAVDGKDIYFAKDLRVGLFQNTASSRNELWPTSLPAPTGAGSAQPAPGYKQLYLRRCVA